VDPRRQEKTDEIATAFCLWKDTRSHESRERLFELLYQWVRRQAHLLLIQNFGPDRPLTTGTLAHLSLIKLLKSLDGVEYRSDPELFRYILKAIRSCMFDAARSPRSHQKRMETPMADLDALDGATHAQIEVDPASGQVTIVGGASDNIIAILEIFERIERLKPQHGVALQMQALMGLQHAEIARLLQIQPAEVDAILRQARSKFRLEWNKRKT
jgi:RNA polymerase sigma factor (sigma-70 family)